MRRFVLALLILLTGCNQPTSPTPTTSPQDFSYRAHAATALTVVSPDGTETAHPLPELADLPLQELEDHDSLFGEARTYEGLTLDQLLSLYKGEEPVEILKFHCRDGFVSEVPLTTLKQGKFLLALRDKAAQPQTFVPVEQMSYLKTEPQQLEEKLQDSGLTDEQRSDLQKQRDHLLTLYKDMQTLKNQGPFYPVFQPDSQSQDKWTAPFCVEKVTFAGQPTDRSAATPKDLDKEHPAMRGARLFEQRCAVCHAVNGVGGKVGPELNQPMSVTAYWEEKALRLLLKDPKKVRLNGKMPAMHLKEDAIDDLLAYLKWMDQHRDVAENR